MEVGMWLWRCSSGNFPMEIPQHFKGPYQRFVINATHSLKSPDIKLLDWVFLWRRKHYRFSCLWGHDCNSKKPPRACSQVKLVSRWIQWHLGESCVEHTTWQHLHGKYLREDIHRTCDTCPLVKRTKNTVQNENIFLSKNAEACPWETLCVDLTGPTMCI